MLLYAPSQLYPEHTPVSICALQVTGNAYKKNAH